MEQLQYQLKAIRLSGMADTLSMRLQEARANDPPPGVGKTPLAIALGLGAIHAGFTVLYRSIFDLLEEMAEAHATMGHRRRDVIQRLSLPQLLILDEFGMKNLPPTAAEDLLEVFHRRYHRGAMIMATNRPLEDWGKILGDYASTSALLERFLEEVHLIKISGHSYRLKSIATGAKAEKNLAHEAENS